jgi:AmmeMemoRadiSam system protein B
MKKKSLLNILMAAMLLLGCSHIEATPISNTRTIEYLPSEYDMELFLSPIQKEMEVTEFDDVSGIICPHHLLASDLIHRIFMTVGNNSYENIVIIGPDHKSVHGLEIALSGSPWQTPFGIMEVDQEFIGELQKMPRVQIDDQLMALEHSSSALLPFIAYYFNEVRVTAIAIPATLSIEESKALGRKLSELIDSDTTLLIASVDFSHYLDYETACKMDLESLDMLVKNDYERIYQANHRHFDSSQTLITFLTYMEEIDCTEGRLIDHGNAFDYIPDTSQGTTSYFTFVYR